MKTKTNIACLVLCLGLSIMAAVIGTTGCAGDRYNRSTGEYIDDNSIKARVNDALGNNPDYKFEGVSTLVFKGTVQLNGFVDMSDQKSKAVDIAKGVEGVRKVVNNISVGNQAESADDKQLADQVNSALTQTGYKFDQVVIHVSQGRVQLGGFVNTPDQKSKAGEAAKAVSGVKDVENGITVIEKM
jgi:hyperosmotically inducible protein